MAKNVFIIGTDDFNRRLLDDIEREGDYTFHGLLSKGDVDQHEPGTVNRLLEEAKAELDAFDGSVDGIACYWDFPYQTMVPLLRLDYGVPGPSLTSVLKCEHKYWSRLEQRKVVPAHVPGFEAFDPFEDGLLEQIELEFPFWVKPVKSTNSGLGFFIEGPEDFQAAVEAIREGIERFSKSFDQYLEKADLPPEVADVSGRFCIAEEILTGDQYTVSGYVYGDEYRVYGVVDSINYPNRPSFFRYQYPSALPQGVKDRMAAIAERVIEHFGYEDGAYNVEFLYDKPEDRISLLEVNPRISQSHAEMYKKVNGASNHRIAVELSVGKRPSPPLREGDFPIAAKFFLRSFEDGTVTRVPSPDEIADIERDVPGAIIDLRVAEGDRLSELVGQDSYSYELAHLHLGGEDEDDLMQQYEECTRRMGVEVEP